MATILRFYEQFSVEDFIIPLILQDKQCIAEEYLELNPKLQIETIQFFDNALTRKSSAQNVFDTFIS